MILRSGAICQCNRERIIAMGTVYRYLTEPIHWNMYVEFRILEHYLQ